jgi:hypothetical protein
MTHSNLDLIDDMPPFSSRPAARCLPPPPTAYTLPEKDKEHRND